jgi:predicted alpha/beta superfamily hydrolase
MISLHWRGAVILTAILSFSAISPAQDSGITIGKREGIQSKVLGEKREILVSVPRQRKPDMPLLVLLDGEWNFTKVAVVVDHLTGNGLLPPMVVAGVVNTNRGRDLAPAFEGAEFQEGPSDKFLSFLSDELIPQLTSEYSLGNYHILAGHSNAGMFSLYAFIRRPEVFQANIALSPSFGLDDRFLALLGRAIAKPGTKQHFVFIGAGGDEEADISVGALRFAKAFESSPNADVEWHYQVFPGETHGTVGLRGFYRGLELVGEADPQITYGPGRYLTEAQRRRHAWVRRFGSTFANDELPRYSAALPMLDAISGGKANMAAFWAALQSGFGDDFRFDPIERKNLIASLEAGGREDEVARLRTIPDFASSAGVTNNYGSSVDLKAGLIASLPLHGSAVDLCHPEAQAQIHDATLASDRHGNANAAYGFNGSDAYIEFGRNADYDNAGSISVTAWVKPRKPAAYSAWVSQVGPRWGSQWRLGFGPNPATQWGATTFGTRWTDYWVNGTGLPTDTWVHTAAVFDQTLGKLHLYLNGREVQTEENLVPWGSSKGPILIGAQRDDGLFFNGDVGEVRVYRRALNGAEVEAINKLETEPTSCK